MKKIYWVFFLVCAACATSVRKEKTFTPEEKIAMWDSGVQYQVDTLPFDPDTDEAPDGGIETTFYTLNGTLMKIKEDVGLSWGNITSTFYCVGDTLRGFAEWHQHFPYENDSLAHDSLVTNYKGILIFQADTIAAEHHVGEKMFAKNTQDFGAQILEEFREHVLRFKEMRRGIDTLSR